MKIADSFLSSLYMKDIETPPSTGLSGTQFSTLNIAGNNDREGPEKYNNTEVKYVATFYSCHTSAFLQE
jgi:hypothetical protein